MIVKILIALYLFGIGYFFRANREDKLWERVIVSVLWPAFASIGLIVLIVEHFKKKK